MAVAPYNAADIEQFDQAITALAKKCCNIGNSHPSIAIRLPVEESGLGVSSLMRDYTQITASIITRALNDTCKMVASMCQFLLPKQ